MTCIACGKGQAKTLNYPAPRSALFTDLKIGLCTNCGMGAVRDRIDPARLHQYYEHDYAELAKRHQRADPSDYFADPGKMFKPQRSRSQLRLAQKRLTSEPRRILDLGAGFGTTLFLARAEFWPEAELTAVEPDLAMQPYLECIGAQIIPGLEKASPSSYDLIIASHVLEHYQAYDIVDVLQKLCSLLTPQGIIVAEVPNSDFQAYPDILGRGHEPHLLFFSQRAFADLFKVAGFKVSFISTVGSPRSRGRVADFAAKLHRRIRGKKEYGPHRAAIRLVAQRA